MSIMRDGQLGSYGDGIGRNRTIVPSYMGSSDWKRSSQKHKAPPDFTEIRERPRGSNKPASVVRIPGLALAYTHVHTHTHILRNARVSYPFVSIKKRAHAHESAHTERDTAEIRNHDDCCMTIASLCSANNRVRLEFRSGCHYI